MEGVQQQKAVVRFEHPDGQVEFWPAGFLFAFGGTRRIFWPEALIWISWRATVLKLFFFFFRSCYFNTSCASELGSQQISASFPRPFLSPALSRAGYGWHKLLGCFGNRRRIRWNSHRIPKCFPGAEIVLPQPFPVLCAVELSPSFNHDWKFPAPRMMEPLPGRAGGTRGCGMCTHMGTPRAASPGPKICKSLEILTPFKYLMRSVDYHQRKIPCVIRSVEKRI